MLPSLTRAVIDKTNEYWYPRSDLFGMSFVQFELGSVWSLGAVADTQRQCICESALVKYRIANCGCSACCLCMLVHTPETRCFPQWRNCRWPVLYIDLFKASFQFLNSMTL